MFFVVVTYFVDGSEIPGDDVTLFRVDKDAKVVVVTDLTNDDTFLADGQEAALERRHLNRDDSRDRAIRRKCISFCYFLIGF